MNKTDKAEQQAIDEANRRMREAYRKVADQIIGHKYVPRETMGDTVTESAIQKLAQGEADLIDRAISDTDESESAMLGASGLQNRAQYTLDDCGCYVDGAHGIYAIDAIVSIGRSHGFQIQEDLSPCSFAGYEFANEIEDECDSYMNAQYGVEGAYWGRNESGDWGLWAIEED